MAQTGTRVADPMATALSAARRALAAGEPPIGACLVLDDAIVAVAHTAVISGLDATAHAEIEVIRAACRGLRRLELTGAALYVTVEPCAMCLAACHYAGIGRVVYGAGLGEFQALTGTELAGDVPPGMVLEGGVEAAACAGLLKDWGQARTGRSAR
jgi:tRNA(adenine34) deaminase